MVFVSRVSLNQASNFRTARGYIRRINALIEKSYLSKV